MRKPVYIRVFLVVMFLGIVLPGKASGELYKIDTSELNLLLDKVEIELRANPDSAVVQLQGILKENKRYLAKRSKVKNGSLAVQARSVLLLGKAFRYQGEMDFAEQYFDSAFHCYSLLNDSLGVANSLHAQGNIHYLYGEFQEAKNKYLEALEWRKGHFKTIENTKTLSNLGAMFYRLSLHDSALYYHNIALSIRKEINDSTGIASSLSNIANVYLYRTKFKEALMNYQEALSYIDTVKVNSYLASITNNIGYSNERTGNYPRAMQYYIKALGYYEILQDKRGQSKLNSSIGNLHIDLDNFAEAEMYLLKGLELFTELRDKMGIADAYLYLGRLYEEKDDKQMSLHYFNLSLELKKVIKDINGIADCYHNLGLIFTDLKKNDTALMMFDLARYNYQESENNYGLATLHNNISNFYFQNKQYRKAYAEAEKANEIASGYGGILEKYDAVKTMAASMQKLGKYKEANALLHDYIVLKDSLLGKQKNEAVLEMTIKYESEKNQRNIDRQRLLLEQRDLQIAKAASEQRSSRMVTNTLILIALLLVFIVIWVYRSFVTSKQLNAKLQNHRKNILDKNEELAKLNEELETQRDQIERTHHTVLEKSNQLEQAHAKIQTSVEYAEYIQQAVLPSKKFIQQILKESFVLYLPKEKVGGDFYYIEEFDNLIYVAVGDCSGHGIPGGFMNMLGMSILRHALAEQEALNPAMVLENMRTGFIEAMNQTNSNSTYHEGIDIALLLYDKDALECTFAGARSQFIHVSENEHTVYKGANASVAQSPNPLPFVNQKIPFRKGDAIYMFTDGVVDQFNPFGEKFGRKRLVDLCLKYSNQPMAYQREVFFQSFKSWKDNYEQIDDALVLGFKI